MRPSSPSKVHIVGGPGSGKSTLARQLAAIMAAPAYDLDEVAYENGAGAKQPLTLRTQSVQAILERPTWVTEGIFLGWTAPLFGAATVVVWLDLPWPVAVWRIIVRHFKRSLAGNNPHPGVLRLLGFVKWQVERYYRNPSLLPLTEDDDSAITRAATRQVLVRYSDKVVRLQSSGEVAMFLHSFVSPFLRDTMDEHGT